MPLKVFPRTSSPCYLNCAAWRSKRLSRVPSQDHRLWSVFKTIKVVGSKTSGTWLSPILSAWHAQFNREDRYFQTSNWIFPPTSRLLVKRNENSGNDNACVMMHKLFLRCHGSLTEQNLRPCPHYAVFALKTRQEEIWKRNNQRSFWICVWGKLGQGNHVIIVTSSCSKSSIFKMFSVHTKAQSRRFKFQRFEERFPKAAFSWRISVNGPYIS